MLYSDQPMVVPDSCFFTSAKNTVFVDGFIRQLPLQMLVDTGICITLLTSKFAQSLQINISPSPIKLSAVNSSPFPVLGQCSIPLSIGDFIVSHSVIVTDIEPDMLVGIDFLRSHGCTLDF